MRFSIVVPIYNGQDYLPACIDSVLAQTCPDWELILINDGSSDESGALAEHYGKQDSRIQVHHKANEGQLFARRDGISRAGGEYVLFLDCDDYWRKDCLEIINREIEQEHPDVIMFPARKFEDGKAETRIIGAASAKKQWLTKEHVYRTLLSGVAYNSMCLKAWKRELFQEDSTDYGAFVGACWGEDKVQLLYPITRAKNVLYLPEPLYYYRDNPVSVIHRVDLSKIPVMLSNRMFDFLYDYMKHWNMVCEETNEAVAVYYLRNFLSVYYRLRREAKGSAERKKFRAYDWNAAVDQAAFRYVSSGLLSWKEKAKLFAAKFVRI